MNSLLLSNSAVKPVRFWEILHSDIPVPKLMIPREFARHYGEDLKDHVVLRVPTGKLWRVDLERDEGEIWLQNGWPQFARFHSLTSGHILFFEYQGSCSFKVVIFNHGAVEIEYPLTSTTHHANFNIRDESVAASTTHHANFNIRDDQSVVASTTHHANFNSGESSRKSLQQAKSARVSSRKRTVYAEEMGPVRVIGASEVDKARAFTSARAFMSQHHSSFMIKIFPSYVAGERLGLNMKASFLEGYVSMKRGNMLVFQIGDKTWDVECTLYLCGQRCRLGSGWTKFARDNSLETGDVCVFERINQSRKLLKVSIFYATELIVD